MSHTEDWQVCDTGEKQHGTEKTVTRVKAPIWRDCDDSFPPPQPK